MVASPPVLGATFYVLPAGTDSFNMAQEYALLVRRRTFGRSSSVGQPDAGFKSPEPP